MMTGSQPKIVTESPFNRGSELLEEYPLHLSDFHDDVLFEVGQAQRHEIFQMDSNKSAGETTLIPMDDNDEVLHFYDIQGESLYTNPPDPNMPTIDHGLEEDRVWAFPKNLYNMDMVVNPYSSGDDFENAMLSHVPFWKDKLMTPAFYKKQKWEKMLMQWDWRLGLAQIQKRQANQFTARFDKEGLKQNREEIQIYLAKIRTLQDQLALDDVYVTDH